MALEQLIARMRDAGYSEEFLALLATCRIDVKPEGVIIHEPPGMTQRHVAWLSREVQHDIWTHLGWWKSQTHEQRGAA
jgi:hypothetical protein